MNKNTYDIGLVETYMRIFHGIQLRILRVFVRKHQKKNKRYYQRWSYFYRLILLIVIPLFVFCLSKAVSDTVDSENYVGAFEVRGHFDNQSYASNHIVREQRFIKYIYADDIESVRKKLAIHQIPDQIIKVDESLVRKERYSKLLFKNEALLFLSILTIIISVVKYFVDYYLTFGF